MPRLVTLGGLAVVDAGTPLSGSAGRGRNVALLALVARAGEAGASRDRLTALLWPESDATRARHSLDQAIYTARRALGADVFLAGATTLSLNEDVVPCDATELTVALDSGDLARAVELYAGPFLDGFHLPGSLELERWIDDERAALQLRFEEALETLARAAADAGDAPAAADRWRRLAAARPLSARVALALMESLEAAGDRSGALQAAGVHAALVRDQLGAEPDPSIAAYQRELREAAERPAAGRSARERSASGRPAAPGSASSSAPAAGGPRTPGGRRSATLAAAVVVAIAAGALAMASARGGGLEPPPAGERPRVAVEPFAGDLGETPGEPLGAMAADWITEGLTLTGLVQVVESSAGADVIVAGRAHRSGDTLWLHARVVSDEGVVLRAIEGIPVVSSHPADGLEALRRRVSSALGTLYDPRLSAWSETALRPPSFDAYQEYAAGIELMSMPRDPEGAIARFRAATDLDPDFVAPRLWMAWAAQMIGAFPLADSLVSGLEGAGPFMSPLEEAWRDRMRALLDGDMESAFRAARRMVDIAPRSGWVISLANAALDTNRPAVALEALREVGSGALGAEAGYGWFLTTAARHQLGAYEDELAAAEEGIRSVGPSWGYLAPAVPALAALGRTPELERRLDDLRLAPSLEDGAPAYATGLRDAVVELRAHGRADDAAALADRRLGALRAATRPGADPEAFRAGDATRRAIVEILYELGRWEEASRALGPPPPDGREEITALATRGLLAARLGDAETARRVSHELTALEDPSRFGEPTFWRARIAAVQGDGDAALDLLRTSFALGRGAQGFYVMHVTRDFDALRGDPDFRALASPRR